MTAPVTNAGGASSGVHRLLDMVVEEVSLVDRAANNHRFLLVKRGQSMTPPTVVAEGACPSGASDPVPISLRSDTSPWTAALTALESLTMLVEQLGSLDEAPGDARLTALAEQLRSTAEQLLGSAGGEASTEDLASASEVEARAPSDAPQASAFSASLAAAKQALSAFAEMARQAPPPVTASPPATPAAGQPTASPSSEAGQPLAKLAASFQGLSESVQQLQQRLARVEKQSGAPNSAPPAEQVTKANDDVLGWPLDLNAPKDREAVDKTVSFHDL